MLSLGATVPPPTLARLLLSQSPFLSPFSQDWHRLRTCPHTRLLSRPCSPQPSCSLIMAGPADEAGKMGKPQAFFSGRVCPLSPSLLAGWATLQIQPQTTSVSAVLQMQAGRQGSCKQPGGDKEKSLLGSLSFPGHVANSTIPSSRASASGKNFPFPVSHPSVAGASHQGRRGLSLLCFGEGAQCVLTMTGGQVFLLEAKYY